MNNFVRNVCRDKLKDVFFVLLSFNLNLNLANELPISARHCFIFILFLMKLEMCSNEWFIVKTLGSLASDKQLIVQNALTARVKWNMHCLLFTRLFRKLSRTFMSILCCLFLGTYTVNVGLSNGCSFVLNLHWFGVKYTFEFHVRISQWKHHGKFRIKHCSCSPVFRWASGKNNFSELGCT